MESPDMKVVGHVFRPTFGTYMWYDRWKSRRKIRA
jgi:hypothetical protein